MAAWNIGNLGFFQSFLSHLMAFISSSLLSCHTTTCYRVVKVPYLRHMTTEQLNSLLDNWTNTILWWRPLDVTESSGQNPVSGEFFLIKKLFSRSKINPQAQFHKMGVAIQEAASPKHCTEKGGRG